jgi:phosphatidylserine/phosphatidylglycerophosphate/cardiolipin synthase-like enzyme
MSTSASGTVSDENGRGIEGLGVVLDDVSQQFDIRLNKQKVTTASDGTFSLSYADYLATSEPGKQPRQLHLRIMLGQHILHETTRTDDSTHDHLTFDPIQLKRGEAESRPGVGQRFATLGKGEPSRFTQGNAIRWLVDNEAAWTHVADVITNATILDLMQLTFEVGDYQLDETQEKPKIILEFDPAHPLFDSTKSLADPNGLIAVDGVPKKKPTATSNPRAIDLADRRIERMILERFQHGVDVRIQIPRMSADPKALLAGTTTAAIAAGIAIFVIMRTQLSLWLRVLLSAGLGLIGVIGLVVDLLDLILPSKINKAFHERELEQWFKTATADFATAGGRNQVRVRELRMRSLFVTHAKILIDRRPLAGDATKTVGKEALLLGSPFEQVYFDSAQHDIADPRRGGDASKGPLHDVSVGVRGPAVGHLQEMFNLHWNHTASDDQLPTAPPDLKFPDPIVEVDPDIHSENPEFIASLQVVRTLDQMFTGDNTDGEEGVLEAYLRAIHFAKHFVYIENQYFKCNRVAQALIDALAENQELVVILLLNVNPDEPFVPRWQRQAIERISNSLKNPSERFGVFSAWSHIGTDDNHPKPRLIDNYLHTKTAIIDNNWATVGSANLDDASQDFVDYGPAALAGEPRNSETNIVLFEDDTVQFSAVDALRRRLWSEHLGTAEESDELKDNSGRPALLPDLNWLHVWNSKAAAKLENLKDKNNLNTVLLPRVLPWPSNAFEGNHKDHVGARPYLELLFRKDAKPTDAKLSQFDVLHGPPKFPFAYPSPADS